MFKVKKAVFGLIMAMTFFFVFSLTNTEAQAASPYDIHYQSIVPVMTKDMAEITEINPTLSVVTPYWNKENHFDLPLQCLTDNTDIVDIYLDPSFDSYLLASETGSKKYFVLDAYVDGLWHYILYNDLAGYVPAHQLSLSNKHHPYVLSVEQDMRTKTGYSGDELELCLKSGLAGLGDAFAAAEQEYGVNALFMIAICQLESASGESHLARANNNLAGMRGGSGWMYFASKAECINHLAKLLSQYYLDPQGAFYHGSTISGVSITYCGGSSHWINSVIMYMNKNYNAITASEEEAV